MVYGLPFHFVYLPATGILLCYLRILTLDLWHVRHLADNLLVFLY